MSSKSATRKAGPVRRRLPLMVMVVSAVVALVAGCDEDSGPTPGKQPPAPPAKQQAKHGPFFPECGGVSDQTVTQQTKIPGLVNTARNSAGCQWLLDGGIVGPHFSFTWYRGSPIGRERETEVRQRTSVDDITIEGHSGFVAVQADPVAQVDSLCEVGIQFDDDFIEWSISFAEQPFPPPCDIAKELTRQSIKNMK
jgi:hypothetical protein